MKQYVAGFLFNKHKSHVALVCKETPEWQRGKFNGIGGKIEPGEAPLAAMVREFKEETDHHVDHWKEFAVLSGDGFVVHFFVATCDKTFNAPWPFANDTGEKLTRRYVDHIDRDNSIPNVPFLIQMARDFVEGSAGDFVEGSPVHHITEVYQ